MDETKEDPQFSLEHLPPGAAPNRKNLYFTAVMSQMAYSLEEHGGKRFKEYQSSEIKDFRQEFRQLFPPNHSPLE
jgi:hypothetical protein